MSAVEYSIPVFDQMSADVPRRSPRRRVAEPSPPPRQSSASTLKAIQEIPSPKCDSDSSSWDERRFSSDSEESIFSECEEPALGDEFELEELGEMTVCSIDDVVTIVAHHTPKSPKRLSCIAV